MSLLKTLRNNVKLDNIIGLPQSAVALHKPAVLGTMLIILSENLGEPGELKFDLKRVRERCSEEHIQCALCILCDELSDMKEAHEGSFMCRGAGSYMSKEVDGE